MGCEKSAMSRENFDHVVFTVKRTCREVALKLIEELDNWFPIVELLNALGIVHPQFWTRDDVEEAFGDHLAIINDELYKLRTIATGDLVGNENKVIDPPLNCKQFLDDQSFFKMIMQLTSPKVLVEQEFRPEVLNPMTRLWRKVGGNPLIQLKMGKWLKLAEIAIVTMMGSMEDERLFSNFSFIKNKLWNRLGPHLECMVRMYTQRFFTLQDFPFKDTITHWLEAERR